MNDKPKGRTIPKQRLHIEKVEMDISYAQGTKFLDRIHAVNLSLPAEDTLADKALRMTIFNDELKKYARGHENIVADIEERPRPDTEYGPDRTIVQIYDDNGEPVSRKKGGGNYRRSLEEDLALEAVKRRSIEGQTAIAQVGAFLTSEHEIDGEGLGLSAEDWTRIVGKYWRAVEKGLDNYLADPPPQTVKLTAADPPETRQKPQNQRQGPDKPDQVSEHQNGNNGAIKNVGDLLTRASKLDPPVTRSMIIESFSVSDPKEIKDLEAAWKTIQGWKLPGKKGAPEKTASENTEEAWNSLNRSGA